MTQTTERILDFENIVKIYGKGFKKVHALKGVDLKLNKGRVLGLLGPNGAGKTTIIKIILGLQKPTSGQFSLFGEKEISRELKERIGFLPEESYLYPFLSIRETLKFTAGLYPNSKQLIEKVDLMLGKVGLSHCPDRKIEECSKGMARRTAMAQALIHDPELILFDEPTSGFDPIGIAEMKDLILDLKQAGKTILLCSHQLNDVEDLCDDILLLFRGEQVVSGELRSLLGEQGEGFAVAPEYNDKLQEILNEMKIPHERFLRGDLEKFFIEKVKDWSSESA